MKEHVIMEEEDEGIIALHCIEVLENAGSRVIVPFHPEKLALNALETSPRTISS
ncbi:MAG: hypothetical protein WCF90_06715 [Methanomicrobiales archaeon]